MENDSEDEVFFGPITEREERIAEKVRNRRTEVYVRGPVLRRRSSVPSLASLEEIDEQGRYSAYRDSISVDEQDLAGHPSAAAHVNSFHRSLPQLSYPALDTQLKNQEPLFVFSHSSREVKECSDDGSTDVSLCVAVGESDSQKSFGWETSSEKLSLSSRPESLVTSYPESLVTSCPESLVTSCDSALLSNTHSEVSDEEHKDFTNVSAISGDTVDCYLKSSEFQLSYISDCNAWEDRNVIDKHANNPVEFMPRQVTESELVTASESVMTWGTADCSSKSLQLGDLANCSVQEEAKTAKSPLNNLVGCLQSPFSKERIGTNSQSLMSREPVNCFSKSSELQLGDISDCISQEDAQVDHIPSVGPVEYLPSRVSKEESSTSKKCVTVVTLAEEEKTNPRATFNMRENVPDATVSINNDGFNDQVDDASNSNTHVPEEPSVVTSESVVSQRSIAGFLKSIERQIRDLANHNDQSDRRGNIESPGTIPVEHLSLPVSQEVPLTRREEVFVTALVEEEIKEVLKSIAQDNVTPVTVSVSDRSIDHLVNVKKLESAAEENKHKTLSKAIDIFEQSLSSEAVISRDSLQEITASVNDKMTENQLNNIKIPQESAIIEGSSCEVEDNNVDMMDLSLTNEVVIERENLPQIAVSVENSGNRGLPTMRENNAWETLHGNVVMSKLQGSSASDVARDIIPLVTASAKENKMKDDWDIVKEVQESTIRERHPRETSPSNKTDTVEESESKDQLNIVKMLQECVIREKEVDDNGMTANFTPGEADSADDLHQATRGEQTSKKENDRSSDVRQSYYSSLKIINVDNSYIYGDFLTEESLQDNGDHRQCHSYEKSQSSEDLDIESYGSANKAMVISRSDNSGESMLPTTSHSSSGTVSEGQHICTSSEESQEYASPVHENYFLETSKTPQKCCNTSTDDTQALQHESPRFNDTVEEMEMMLKYGINYGEAIQKKAATIDSSVDDTIVGMPRNSSVSSTISNFQPTLESTRESPHQKHVKPPECVESVRTKASISCSPYKPQSVTRKEPPPKPPRNVFSPSPKKPISLLASTPNTPKFDSTHSNEVRAKQPHNRLISPKKGCHGFKGTPVQQGTVDKPKIFTRKHSPAIKSNERPAVQRLPFRGSGLTRSGSLTNIRKPSNLYQSPGRTPIIPCSVSRIHPRTPVSRHNTPARLQSPSTIFGTKPGSFSSLPPHPTPQKASRKLLKQTPTPGTKLPAQTRGNIVNKTPSPAVSRDFKRFKPRLNIESPLAKCLQVNPAPTLLVNVKPRHNISPQKMQKKCLPVKKIVEAGDNHHGDSGKCNLEQQQQLQLQQHHQQQQRQQQLPPKFCEEIENSFIQRETALSNIQDNLNKLELKMKNSQVLAGEESTPSQPTLVNKEDQILPDVMYSSAVPVLVNEEANKENERLRRRMEMLTDKQPALVSKHKGRMKMPKVAFNIPPKGSTSPVYKREDVSSPRSSAARGSLLEVSLYESHEAHYTNTLR
nr:uncharacterized protein LOC128697223 isoform X1 [Cherax quadricarinatus]